MSLLRISRKLWFRVFNHGDPYASFHTAKEEKSFYKREKGKWESYWKQRVHDFSLAKSLSGKKNSFSSSSWALLSFYGRRAPHSGLPTLFNWVFCSKFFYIAENYKTALKKNKNFNWGLFLGFKLRFFQNWFIDLIHFSKCPHIYLV